MLDRLKLLPLTIVLTILIWMYAEAEFTATREGVDVLVQIQSPDPNEWLVRAIDPTDPSKTPRRTLTVRLTIQGAKSRVEQIGQQSTGVASPDPSFAGLRLAPTTAELSGGRDTLSIVPLLNAQPYFRNKGVTVLKAAPDFIKLDVDRLTRFNRPVELQAGLPVTDVMLSPATAEVSVPIKTLESLGGESRITVKAQPQQVISGPVGSVVTVPVRLVAQANGLVDDRITVVPQIGSATLKIQARLEKRLTLRDLPVFVSGPPTMLAKYTVQIKPEQVSVEVAGPPAAIDHLAAAMNTATEPPARAYLDLLAEDQPGPAVRRRVRLTLPEGIHTVQGGRDSVEFRLLERNSGP